MKKRIIITISSLLLLTIGLAGIKGMQFGTMIAMGENFVQPPETVTATQVRQESWENTLATIGSLKAFRGVQIPAELAGKVVNIAFEPGSTVKAGALLLQQDTSYESAQLRAAEASVQLAHINRDRKHELLAKKMISQAEFDISDSELKAAQAQADSARALIAKKNLRAPFAGHLGTREVDLGQNLKEGETVVSLQAMDPIFVNFQIPQSKLTHIKKGLRIRISADTLPNGQTVTGKITAINPSVDPMTRNISLQATVANPQELLLPGMFVNLEVILPAQKPVSVIPATAILYAPYGNSVFVIEEKKNTKTGNVEKSLRQQFIRLGETRGDFVTVTSGLKQNESIVTSGVFKLRNGQTVVVDNKLQPDFKLKPSPKNS